MSNKIEEILMHDELYRKHFVAKHPPKYKFSGEINPAFLGRHQSADYAINKLIEYIKFPLVEDNFHMIEEGTLLRKAWRKELGNRYGKEIWEFMNENKLRKNAGLVLPYNVSSIIEAYLGNEYPKLRKYAEGIINLGVDNTETYLDMNLLQKIELVRKMEDQAYEFLNLLCTK